MAGTKSAQMPMVSPVAGSEGRKEEGEKRTRTEDAVPSRDETTGTQVTEKQSRSYAVEEVLDDLARAGNFEDGDLMEMRAANYEERGYWTPVGTLRVNSEQFGECFVDIV